MNYQKVGWTNNQAPAINALNLEHMEDGILTIDNRTQNQNAIEGITNYNGIVNVNDKKVVATQFIMATTKNSMNWSTAWTVVTIPFNVVDEVIGDFELVNYGIKVGAGIKKVKITAWFNGYYNNPSNDEMGLQYYKNGIAIDDGFGHTSVNIGATVFPRISGTSKFLDVVEGDIITARVNRMGIGTINLLLSTAILVEVVE